jgi:AcrR family transcriptional regulator
LADEGAKSAPARKPRADATRNRIRLIDAAKAAFTDAGADVTLDEIARRAGVGIGTLYRHFPNRDLLLQAVYRHEVEQLAEAATRLLGRLPPAEALRAWMRLFVDYIATKKIIAPALSAITEGTSELFESSGTHIKGALSLLVGRAAADGAVRSDIEPIDLLYALVGFAGANDGLDWAARAHRLIDILVDGLRPPPRAAT